MTLSRRSWWPVLGVLSATLVLLDYVTPPDVLFLVTFGVPVMLGTWFIGVRAGLVFALALPLARMWIESAEQHASWVQGVNFAIAVAALALLVLMVDRIAALTHRLEHRVEQLEGILPVCSYCKKIRSESGAWVQMETYISSRSSAQFSHGFCEDCLHKHYPDLS